MPMDMPSPEMQELSTAFHPFESACRRFITTADQILELRPELTPKLADAMHVVRTAFGEEAERVQSWLATNPEDGSPSMVRAVLEQAVNEAITLGYIQPGQQG